MSPPDSITGALLDLLAQPRRAAELTAPLAADPKALQAMLDYHRLAPWLYEQVRRADVLGLLPPPVRTAVEQQRLKEMARGLGRHRDLCRLAQVLREAQVQAWVLKGGHLAYRYYADPLQRPMSDLDILIVEADFDRAIAAILGMGYELQAGRDDDPASHNLANLVHPSAFHIDLHKHFESPGIGTLIPLDPVLARSVAHPAIPSLRVFSPEDQLLHCCLHASLHHLWRISLIGLVDIQQILLQEPTLDWPAIVDRARQWRALPHLAATLAIVCETLATPWPPEAQRLLTPALPSAVDRQRILELLRFDYSARNPAAGEVVQRLGDLQGPMNPGRRALRLLVRLTGAVDRAGRPTGLHGGRRLRQAWSAWRGGVNGGIALLAVAVSRDRRRAVRNLADYNVKRQQWQQSADPLNQPTAKIP